MKYTFLFFLLFSCIENDKSVELIKRDSTDVLKNEIILKGDNRAFSKFVLHCHRSNRPYEILPYALIMANQYKNSDGYYQVYESFLRIKTLKEEIQPSDLKLLNEVEKEFVIHYLTMGAENNDLDCLSILHEIYNNNIYIVEASKKDSIRAKIDKLLYKK